MPLMVKVCVSSRCRSTVAWLIAVVVGCSLMMVQGCRVLNAPSKAVHAITPGSRPKTEPEKVALIVQQLADEYALRIGQALDQYAQIRGTPEAASEVLRWKAVMQAYSMRIAGGYNPYGSLIDMVALISLNRTALEDHWVHTTNGAAFEPWLEASRVLETNAWDAAIAVFTPKQIDQLRSSLQKYRSEHVSSDYPLFARPLEFAAGLKSATASEDAENQSVLGFVGLDPTMGLDPAVQEVTRTRLFAERAMYTMQRMPNMIRLQTEILADDVLRQTQLQQTFSNTASLTESADRISRAAERISVTTAELPDRFSAERAVILSEMERQEGKLRELSAEVGRSIGAAEQLSDSLTITVTNFDALMKRFGVGEVRTNEAPNTNSQPFNILDYSQTAERIGAAARELNSLIGSVDQATPQVARFGQQAQADARKLINHCFQLGLIMLGVILVGAVSAGLIYRALARKLFPTDNISVSESRRERDRGNAVRSENP